MGIGNGVFHPADFAILNANVAPRRLGHAYSAHGIGGNLGYALAPVVGYGLGAAFGWRHRARDDGRRRRSSSLGAARDAARGARLAHSRGGAHAHTLARQPARCSAAGDPAVLRRISCIQTMRR